MRKTIMMILLTVVSSSAAAEWFKYGENENNISYVNLSTIRKKGDKVKMWVMHDYKVSQELRNISPFLSGTAQNEYDCKEEQIRQLYLTWDSGNMGKGTAVHINQDIGKWTPVPPDTMVETEWKIACGKK